MFKRLYFNYTVKCNVKTLKPQQKDETYSFVAGSPAMRIQIIDFL
jgi:hypothetical protein